MHLNFSTDHTGDRCTDFNTYSCRSETQSTESFSFGGISWTLPQGCKMEDVEIVWLGDEGPALTNIMLTFNASTITIYDAEKNVLVVDVKKQSKFLMRRYYLVERAKDANIVGIVVGTLGVAGYLEMVQDLKALLKQSGKKSYVLSMGKPNPAKLANFPECDIFVLVACPQTALLDSKDYMVPVITPFEAIIAWQRGRQWTGEYLLDLRSLRKTLNTESDDAQPLRAIQSYDKGEARFSFIKGSYIEDNVTDQSDDGDHSFDSLALTKAAEYALQMQKGRTPMSVDIRPQVQSGVEFFALRSFQGLELDDNHQKPIEHYTVGQRGRSVAYANEQAKDLGYGA
ncbi:hypothetical protein KP509_35G043700 [Ceratopteris richardii]|nr:hypothetical protein KP509_35G043700 [Ceratopteris richardii]